jgi:hypothetical protein
MIALKYAILATLDLLLLPVWFVAAPVYSLFTASGWPSWGVWFQTYDNPPEGDARHIRTYGTGYYQRVLWLWRNPGYGFAKMCSIGYGNGLVIKIVSASGWRDEISDKYGKAGHYLATCRNIDGDLIAFELYIVKPSLFGKCLRVRIGWKILTDKFASMGFAPLVNTINPIKSYGQ